MKKLLALLLALVMVLTMVACDKKAPEATEAAPGATEAPKPTEAAPEASGDVEVVTYFCTVGAYLDVLQREIDAWNEGEGKAAGVYIELTSNINEGSSANEVLMQAGTYHDITDGTNNAAWVANGWVKDLYEVGAEDPEIQALIDYNEQWFVPGLNVVNGILVGMPLEVVPIKLAVNTDLFDKNGLELPKTWADIVECAKVITENGNGEEFGFGGTNWSIYFRRLVMKASMNSTEVGYWDPNTETYSFAQYEVPVKAVAEMYQNGWMLGLDDLAIDPIRAEFANGKVGMFPAPSYDYAVYTNQFPAVCNWTVIDMPTIEEGDAPYKGVYLDRISQGICAPAYDNATPEHQAAIRKAYLFLNSVELNTAIYKAGGMIPYDTNIIANTTPDAGENFAKFAEIENYTGMFVKPDAILQLEGDTFEQVFSAIVHGDLEWSDEVIQDLEQRYNDAYAAAKADPDIDTSNYAYAYDHSK